MFMNEPKKNKNQMVNYILIVICFFSFPLQTTFSSSFNTNALSYTESESSTSKLIQKRIALTFDDGPYGKATTDILNILKKENIHATFFLVGSNVKKYPDIARRIVSDNNLIGNHTYSHSRSLPYLSAKKFEKEITKTENIIASTTGIHTIFFRPPFGVLSKTMNDVLNKHKYTIFMWTVDPHDWDYKKSPTNIIVSKVLQEAKPESIILLHDGRDTQIGYPRDNTVQALPIIIKRLKKDGYTFVTLDKLIN